MHSLGTGTQTPVCDAHFPAAGSHHSPLSQSAAAPQDCPAGTALAGSLSIAAASDSTSMTRMGYLFRVIILLEAVAVLVASTFGGPEISIDT